MLTLTLAALLAAPAVATTTVTVSSGWAYGDVGAGDCGDDDGSVTATTSFSTSSASIADITGIHVDIAGSHGGCEVAIDSAVLYLDGTAIWSQSVGVSGSGLDCCEWYIDLDYSPSDQLDQVLSSGTHTLTLDVTGTVQGWGEQIAAAISATVEHGSDWDGDGYDATAVGGSDCDDDDATVSPGATEVFYDGTDQDCDGGSDYDADGDGYDSSSYSGSDCDDSSAAVSPSATELCNGIDDDCDGSIDEASATDALTWYADGDGDGYGDPASTTDACSAPSGYVATATDCDDGDATVSPAGTETCNGVDDDCDGSVDEGAASGAPTWYADSDGDGYGDAASTTAACSQPSGYAASSTDCDDGDGAVNPGATELCNGIDDDCDGTVDEPDASDATTWYLDADGDGYGVSTGTSTACSQPSGYAATATDCDDGDAAVNPDATELCNGVDDDCDGSVDEDTASDATTWYADSDGDGYGDPASTTTACSAPSGHVATSTDCDDGDAAVSPGASEWCNGIDDDCDGSVDEDDAVDASTWYADGDGDGFAGTTGTTTACDQPAGYHATATDCDDGDASVNPDATEIWYDGVDQDCDGGSDYDADDDGWDHSAYGGDDCDDDDPLANPDAEERWYDGVDGNCDGASDYDMDGDGFDSASYGGEDCDDDDPDTWPGAPDDPYDGVINDCDASDEYDMDGDGHDAEAHGGDDCDDANSGVNPDVEEIWYDGVDQDCDGNDDDQDEDGWPLDDDCDDLDPTVNPDATEIWYDGVDQDCDGNDDDQDGDGWTLDDDCDDTDPASYPGAPGLDDDCEPIDTGQPDDTDLTPGDSDPPGPSYRGGGGCTGCGGGSGPLGLAWLLALGIALRRRNDPL
jgi:large repetitive protein